MTDTDNKLSALKKFFFIAVGEPWQDHDPQRMRTAPIHYDDPDTGRWVTLVYDATPEEDDRWTINKCERMLSFTGVYDTVIEEVAKTSSKEDAKELLASLETRRQDSSLGKKSKNHYSHSPN